MSGHTARQIARHRPSTVVMAISPLPQTQRRLSLVWGVECLVIADFSATDEMLAATVKAMKSHGLEAGDRIVFTAGVPFGARGQTNLIQVHEVT